MTPYSSDKVKYNSVYLSLLMAYSIECFLMPIKNVEELLQLLVAINLYIVVLVTFPVSLPAIYFVKMKLYKRKLVKLYGVEELTK